MTDGRCLSCPIRPQEAENLSLSDGKGNIEDSPPLSIIAAETLYFDDLHSIPPHVHGVSHLHADYSRLKMRYTMHMGRYTRSEEHTSELQSH